jgi:hypothetical protein
VKYIEDGGSPKEAEDVLHHMLKGTAEMMEDVKAGRQMAIDFEAGKS